jgi:hypothetical protein
MSTEADFKEQLNVDPLAWETRLAFANWLVEQGDLRATGHTALVLLRRSPVLFDKMGQRWLWMNARWAAFYPSRAAEVVQATLPDDWYDCIPQITNAGYHCAIERLTISDSLDDAALAFAQLPLERQAELLATRPIS